MSSIRTIRAVVLATLATGVGACGTPNSDNEVAEGDGVVNIGIEQHSVQDLETSSSRGNAHDFYTAKVVYSETGVLFLSFATPNFPGRPSSFPLESEELQFPIDDVSVQSITAVTGKLCLPDCLETVVDLLGSARGTFLVSGGVAAPLFNDLDLTFPATEISTEAYTDTSPEVHVTLPMISFPSL